MRRLKKLLFILLFAGSVIWLIGFYYSAIKAGIPYQDPTPEMTEKYMSFMKTGDKLMIIGFIIFIIIIIVQIMLMIVNRKKRGY